MRSKPQPPNHRSDELVLVTSITLSSPGAKYNFSDNGWMTAAIFFAWLCDVFIPATASTKKPILLLVDGHASHTSLVETSLLCEENGIVLYCFLAHASHMIQPLDQAVFGSVKPAWSAATKQFLANHGEAVNLEHFAAALRPVWDKCCTNQGSGSEKFQDSRNRALQSKQSSDIRKIWTKLRLQDNTGQPYPHCPNRRGATELCRRWRKRGFGCRPGDALPARVYQRIIQSSYHAQRTPQR